MDRFEQLMGNARGAGELPQPRVRPPSSVEWASHRSPSLMRELWVLQVRLNDDVRGSQDGARLANSGVEECVYEHGFEARLIESGEMTRVWQLTRRGEYIAFLHESDLYGEPFQLFAHIDGIRFT